MKSSILKTLENWEGYISSTLRIWIAKKPSSMPVRNWRHQLLLLCLEKLWKIVGVVHPTKLRQNLRGFWKLMNPQGCVWENLYRINIKTILQEKENSLQHYNLVQKFILCFKPWFFCSKGSSGQGMGKIGKRFRRGTWPKSKVRKWWSMKQGPRALQFILHH